METMADRKSRKESRKEAQQAKKQNKHQSWIGYQKSQKVSRAQQAKTKLGDSRPKYMNRSENSKKSQGMQFKTNSGKNQSSDKTNLGKKSEPKPEPILHDGSTASKIVKQSKGSKRNSKTKFEEYLGMDMKNADMLGHKDLEMERRLAKKLKVKGGQLRGMDDEINFLLEGIPSLGDSFDKASDAEEFPIEGLEKGTFSKKHKKRKASDESSGDDIAADMIDGVFEPEETSDAEMDWEESDIDTNSRKKLKKRKKSKKMQEGSILGDTGNGEIAGDIMGRVSEPEEISGAEMGQEGGNSILSCERLRKKSQKEGSGVVGDTTLGVPKAAQAHKAEAVSQKTPFSPLAMPSSVKYVAPHLRSVAGKDSDEHTQIRRRVRGLLNRLSEANVESVTGELATIFRSLSRSVSSQIISDEVLVACSNGPRGNEQYAAVFAAFVAGMACSVGMDFSAKLLASLAKSFEDEYLKEDNLSLRNLTLLLSYLCIMGVCSSDLIFDFLIMLSKQLTEIDVSTILTVLQYCGMKIRSDDPTAMKDFIQSVQSRVNELKASSEEEQGKIIGRRMEFMLETICDIKNNKKRPKEDSSQHMQIKKWLQK